MSKYFIERQGWEFDDIEDTNALVSSPYAFVENEEQLADFILNTEREIVKEILNEENWFVIYRIESINTFKDILRIDDRHCVPLARWNKKYLYTDKFLELFDKVLENKESS